MRGDGPTYRAVRRLPLIHAGHSLTADGLLERLDIEQERGTRVGLGCHPIEVGRVIRLTGPPGLVSERAGEPGGMADDTVRWQHRRPRGLVSTAFQSTTRGDHCPDGGIHSHGANSATTLARNRCWIDGEAG